MISFLSHGTGVLRVTVILVAASVCHLCVFIMYRNDLSFTASSPCPPMYHQTSASTHKNRLHEVALHLHLNMVRGLAWHLQDLLAELDDVTVGEMAGLSVSRKRYCRSCELENETPEAPEKDLTLKVWEETPVLTNATVRTNGQSQTGLKGLFARQVWSLNRYEWLSVNPRRP